MTIRAIALLSVITFASTLPAQDPVIDDPIELTLPEEHPSQQRESKPTAKELRQARALYRSQQRIKRLEYYQWMRFEPLRPNWNTTPAMTSPYPWRQTIYVPVYIR